MDLFSNTYLITNISKIITAFLIAFGISFVLAPLVARIANRVGAVDLPPHLRKKTDKSAARKIHSEIIPKWGGLAMIIAIILALIFTENFEYIPNGILLGMLAISVVGIIDDRFDTLSGNVMILGQIIAASIVVVSGISITSINILGARLDFNMFSAIFELGKYSYNFIFPADFLTILWIVGLINVVNWVGGVDGLNASVTSVILFTMLLFAAGRNDIVMAMIIAIHLGSIQGVFPYNYNPAKIYYGSSGDYLNGFLLAVFAIMGSTRWTTTMIVLALPIIDGLLVVLMRLRDHPEARKNPLKLLSISDKNHFHHRLLRAGYSRKMVTLIEVAIVSVVCGTAIIFSDLQKQYVAFLVGFVFLFAVFTLVFFLMIRKEKNKTFGRYLSEDPRKTVERKEAVVKVIMENDAAEKEEDYDKFIY